MPFRSTLTLTISLLVLIVSIIYRSNLFNQDDYSYTVDAKYFGRNISESSNTEDLSIRKFQVPYDQNEIDEFKTRLIRARFYEPQLTIDNESVNRSTYGFNRQTAEYVRNYFLNKFNWEKMVDQLNEFEHYKTKISGIDIHFVRITRSSSTDQKKQPIIFLHGWPGSFLEYLSVARLLNSSTNANYDLIIPSLPGYGYSEAAKQSGMNPIQIARIMNVLMQRLGYESYFVCGGDWGSIIATFMAQLYPKNVRGLMITLVVPTVTWQHVIRMGLSSLISSSILLDEDENKFLDHSYNALSQLNFLWIEGGYFHLQSTKPDTIGYGLNDSPLGLACYILEKWSRWSNPEKYIDQSDVSGLDRFDFDQLLSNVMLYWTTGTITSSMRIYFEYFQSFTSGTYNQIFDGPVPNEVPVAIVNYRHEILYVPRIIAQSKYPNISLWINHEQGGHFAAMELPQEYANDVEKFVMQYKTM